MPLIDSFRGIALGEINPDKRHCQYVLCQAYEKHKTCAKCKYARYCSAECQRADWPTHKRVCKGFKTPIMDAAAWRDTHDDLFKWAAVHALRTHWDPTYIHTHGLLLNVLFGNRLHGASPTPSHFELTKIEALSFEEMEARTHGAVFHSARDLANCQRIQDEGGLGLAIVIFQYCNTEPVDSRDFQCVNFVERYALTEPRDPGCPRLSSLRVLENTVRGHINGVALPVMLARPQWSRTQTRVSTSAPHHRVIAVVGCGCSTLPSGYETRPQAVERPPANGIIPTLSAVSLGIAFEDY